nr:hypothetical protein [Tanacetum cinerariifolium]
MCRIIVLAWKKILDWWRINSPVPNGVMNVLSSANFPLEMLSPRIALLCLILISRKRCYSFPTYGFRIKAGKQYQSLFSFNG